MRYRIIDNNGMWSNIHHDKAGAIDEVKRQRDYDKAFYVYGLQRQEPETGEWFTLEWFDDPYDCRFIYGVEHV